MGRAPVAHQSSPVRILGIIGFGQEDSEPQAPVSGEIRRNSLTQKVGPVLQRLVAQRGLIGWLALVGLLGGGLLCLLSEAQQGGAGGSLLRVGVVLGSLWLALPDQYVPGTKVFSLWQGGALLLVMVLVVKRPLVVIPVLMILGALSLFARPRR